MQNKRSRMLHLRSPDLRNKLQPVTECGLHGPGFITLEDGAAFEWPKCSRCFEVDAAPSGLSATFCGSERKRSG